MDDRDSFLIKGKRVRRTTAVRDWVCGNCGSALRTIWTEEPPHWQTVCGQHPEHPADGFVHKTTWTYLEHQRWKEAAQAKEVWDNLPAEVQALIQEEG